MTLLYLRLPDLPLAVELRRAPALRGVPLIIGGLGGGRGTPRDAPRGDPGRDALLAVSPEAARDGVDAAMTPGQARFACPEVVCLPPDAAAYLAAARAAAAALERLSPTVEPDGLEGAWLDARGLGRLWGDDDALARRATDEVARATGLDAAAGIGPTRLVATLAARAATVQHPVVVPPERIEGFLHGLPVGWLPLSAETLERLELLGVRRVGQFLRLPPAGLARRVGPDAARARAALLGERAEALLAPTLPRRIVARLDLEDGERCLAPGDAAGQLADLLAGRLGAKGLTARTLDLELELADGRRLAREAQIKDGTADTVMLRRAALALLFALGREAGDESEVMPRALTLGAGDLARPDARQLGLFEAQRARRERADWAVGAIAGRFGAGRVAWGGGPRTRAGT